MVSAEKSSLTGTSYLHTLGEFSGEMIESSPRLRDFKSCNRENKAVTLHISDPYLSGMQPMK